MRAYSPDLRQRVFVAWSKGLLGAEEIAEEFGVSRAYVYRVVQRYYQGYGLAPRLWQHGPEPLLDAAQRKQLRGLVDEHRDATLQELRHLLRRHHGPEVSVTTLWRALQPLDRPLKKRRSTPANWTPRGCSDSAASGENR